MNVHPDPLFEFRPDANGHAPEFTVAAMNRQQLRSYRLSVAIWALTVVIFWVWWLNPAHIADTLRFTLISTVLAWLTLMPVYFLRVVMKARRPSNAYTPISRARIAMVVTKAPSEPFSVVAETLEAMLAQPGAHDTWLADERPTSEVLEWCVDRGVQVSTRYGREDYHRAAWPRRTRCKEGNLAYFYDSYGYDRYDFVVQMDADHVPESRYLEHMLQPFADPRVGYVSAPSICDKNANASWSARGRLYAEVLLHGPLQAGHTANGASLCIGSHYAVRTAALREIGGLGPELAEDHSTSMLMVAGGWRGVHAFDAIAHGDGPQTFADMVTQEFQWSRSLMNILLGYSPTYLPRMARRQSMRFLFWQTCYSLLAFFSLLMFFMPIIALSTTAVFANVGYPQFVAFFLPNVIMLLLITFQLKRFGMFRPYDGKAFSWELVFFTFARWPWVLAGTLAAIGDHVTKRYVDFRVTPKGSHSNSLPPLRVSMLFVVLTFFSALPVFLAEKPGKAVGFYWFASLNALFYGILLMLILVQHCRENAVPIRSNLRGLAGQGGLAAIAIALACTGLTLRGMESLYALQIGIEPLRLIRVLTPVTGAGLGGEGKQSFIFAPGWDEQ